MTAGNKPEHLFGPVPSRRLGQSLGIDLIPYKTCTFDCIYCQLGKTTEKTAARAAYTPVQRILEELDAYLRSPHGPIDYLTLSGSGEPTLHSELGRIIASIKRISEIPVAVLTNGSLLHDPEVRRELAEADLVIPTLAADTETVYQCVHRPAPSISFARHVEGLVCFAEEFRHHLWIELFLLQGITAMEKNVAAMNRILEKIRPEKIQINTATRPPCEDFAFPVPEKRLRMLSKLLRGNVEIVAERDHQAPATGRSSEGTAILELIRRRPCTVEDVSTGLSIHAAEASKVLSKLVSRNEAKVCRKNGKTYFKGTELIHASLGGKESR
ncbi:MAG: radical SAM protein [Chitinispirillaceae bacterium]|nr:radical SAM protein [Chitinispirillaceae bacterium]